MKKILMLSVLILGFAISSSSYSQPQPWKSVGYFVETTTERLLSHTHQMEATDGQSEWKFAAGWLRIQAQFGISVPWLAALKVVPEVELIFDEK
ncbi:MAG: hypothetical protein ACXVCY_03095 [Pseudobdellovibrionaceae bacterium]